MAGSGYSGTPVFKKLGLKPGIKLQLINEPDHYFDLIGKDIEVEVVKSGGEMVHMFAVSRKELEKTFLSVITKALPGTIIWISWYKKSAKIPTDITEDVIREMVLPTGWVDIKVCAVDELWSGLKMVKRKQ